MAIQISVLSSTINYKSIDVAITGDLFKVSDTFTLTYTTSNTTVTVPYDYIVFNKDKLNATLVFNSTDLLSLGKTYTLTLNRTGLSPISTTFTFEDQVSIEDSILVAHGTNFLTLTFPYPVNIIPSDPETDEIMGSPFFALPENLPIGTPNIHLSESVGFEWISSADLKSINIETLDNPFNVGQLSVFTNFPLTNATLDGYEKAKDYSPAQRNLPLILSDTAIVPSVPKKVTTVESVKNLESNKILVTFTIGVLSLLQGTVTLEYDDIIYSTANALIPGAPLLTITRPDYNNPNQLIYAISQNGVAPELQPQFAPGFNTVTLNGILDANNNLTAPATVKFKVPDQAPNVVSANAINEGEVLLGYDQVMDTTSPITSALIAGNYAIVNLPGTPAYTGHVVKVTVDSTPPTVVKLELSDPLLLGSYEITVSNVENLAQTPLDTNSAQFKFTDIVDTTVTILGYAPAKGGTGTDQYDPDPINHDIPTEGNKFVLTYNKAMITGTSAQYSADNTVNFRIIDSTANPPLVPETKLGLLYPTNILNLYPATDKTFRMTILPTTLFTPFALEDTRIEVGYAYREEGQYKLRTVRSQTGVDVNLDTAGTAIDAWGTDMLFCNTTFGSMHLLLDGSIHYEYYQPLNGNKFFSIDKDNLLIYQDSDTNLPTPIISTELSEENGKSIIIFKFAPNAINTATRTIIVKEVNAGESITDIFGNPVLFDTVCEFELKKDKILPEVIAASLVSIDQAYETLNGVTTPLPGYNKVKAALFFNKKMMYTSDYDFVLSDNSFNTLQVPIASILASKITYPGITVPRPFELAWIPDSANLTLITVEGLISNVNNSSNAQLSLSTNLSKHQLSTEDINSNEMAVIVPPKPIVNLKGTTFTSKAAFDNGHIDAYFTAKYEKELSETWTDNLGFTKENNRYKFNVSVKYYIDDVELADFTPLPANKLIRAKYSMVDFNDSSKEFGSVTSYFYTKAEAVTPVAINFIGWANFTADKFGIDAEVEQFMSPLNANKITFANAFFVPAPYVLIDSTELLFVDTSYKATSLILDFVTTI